MSNSGRIQLGEITKYLSSSDNIPKDFVISAMKSDGIEGLDVVYAIIDTDFRGIQSLFSMGGSYKFLFSTF